MPALTPSSPPSANPARLRLRAAVSAGGLLLVLLAGCGRNANEAAAAVTGGDPEAGRATIKRAGCATCHTIPGIPGANARVGPPLAGVGVRGFIGGVLPNRPDNLIAWLLDPPAQNARTVMPNLGLTEPEARDVAAYLYTLPAR